jgi:hypothetical protein
MSAIDEINREPGFSAAAISAEGFELASLGVEVTYDDQIGRFWKEIRAGWQAQRGAGRRSAKRADPVAGPSPCRLRVTCRC